MEDVSFFEAQHFTDSNHSSIHHPVPTDFVMADQAYDMPVHWAPGPSLFDPAEISAPPKLTQPYGQDSIFDDIDTGTLRTAPDLTNLNSIIILETVKMNPTSAKEPIKVKGSGSFAAEQCGKSENTLDVLLNIQSSITGEIERNEFIDQQRGWCRGRKMQKLCTEPPMAVAQSDKAPMAFRHLQVDSPTSSGYHSSTHVTPMQDIDSPFARRISGSSQGYNSGSEQRGNGSETQVFYVENREYVAFVAGSYEEQAEQGASRTARGVAGYNSQPPSTANRGYVTSHSPPIGQQLPFSPTSEHHSVSSPESYGRLQQQRLVSPPHHDHQTLTPPPHLSPPTRTEDYPVQIPPRSHQPHYTTLPTTSQTAPVQHAIKPKHERAPTSRARKRSIAKVQNGVPLSKDEIAAQRKDRRKETNRRASQKYRERQSNTKSDKIEKLQEATKEHQDLKIQNAQLRGKVSMLLEQFSDAVLKAV